MARTPTFHYRKTSKGWLVNIPSGISDTGRFRRRYFATRDLAKAESQRLREIHQGQRQKAADIPAALAESALAAAEMLRPFGISLVEAATRTVAAEKARLASETVERATKAFLLAKEGVSKSQERLYRFLVRDLLADFPKRTLSGITAGELEDGIAAHNPTPAGFNQRLKQLSTFWGWCARPPRKWCEAQVIATIERKRLVAGETGVLTPGDAKRLLETAEREAPGTVPGFVLSLFTGIRQAELKRLRREDIAPAGITVPARSAKTGRRRFIAMPANVAAWLAAYPVTGEMVLPSNWGTAETRVRRLAGWRVWSKQVEPHTPPAELPPWKQNVLRHTAASVAVALGKGIEHLTFEHGHSGGTGTLKRHYLGIMSPESARAIWTIGPRGTTLPPDDMALPAVGKQGKRRR